MVSKHACKAKELCKKDKTLHIFGGKNILGFHYANLNFHISKKMSEK